MRFHVAKMLCAIGAIFLCHFFALSGAEVRICFFQDTNSLNQTIEFLLNNGCSKQGTAVFEQAVHKYFKEPFAFDLSKFPKPTNGFCTFASPQDLIAAFPTQFPEPSQSFIFNCTDAVIAIADGRLRTTSRPHDPVGPILVSTGWVTNREQTQFAATPIDAFNLSLPPLVREDPLFPASMRDARICLTPFLLQWHLLPQHTNESNVERMVLPVLRASWKRERVELPSQFEVVLLHTVGQTIETRHAGLLFQRGKAYTYLEKAGNRGPFVRLDLDDRSDLMPWLAMPLGKCTNSHCHHFATFNDRVIKEIDRQ